MNASREACARLLTLLDAEERLYLELRSVLQREREALVALDAAAVEDVVRHKEALAEEGRLLEEGRVELALALARELGISEARPTLSQLCLRLGDAAGPLAEAHGRLVALVGAVRELLTANAAFAGDALTQVRVTLRLLGRLLPTTSTYAPLPATEPALPSGRLVQRSA